jgi:hypothetical protein
MSWSDHSLQGNRERVAIVRGRGADGGGVVVFISWVFELCTVRCRGRDPVGLPVWGAKSSPATPFQATGHGTQEQDFVSRHQSYSGQRTPGLLNQ